ncbi:hypothetical protein [Microbacterium arabinogalactanolyticum]|uniref:Gram-positive cocci surface proteins LPxTG domain-containing protein n=1 Tax=Microbacterium arabinogalactanolyticum TaxID=69365 RepID=A0ABQ5NDE1_9MICO|nr:hypothetical protein [Microbacterium arabinogalactanolyticum]GLC83678.1 hypothetical protein MIAR_02660 [Microbacterium arabinogalactanolyticum]
MNAAVRIAGRVGRALRETLLTLAAVGGVACVVLTILAFTGGYSLIMFKTGSMSPTIPAGSVALVQRVPASDLAVGDVTTVDRAGELPITHRITGVSPGPTSTQRVITMKGDANQSADPAPYTISEARIVRGSLPGLAYVIVWFGSPWVLGTITVGAALLVTWAFWPRVRRPAPADAEDDPLGAEDDALRSPEFASRRERRLGQHVASCVAIGMLVALPSLTSAPPAGAAELISITSNGGGTHVLDAVRPYDWDLDIDAASAPADGELTVTLRGEGHGVQLSTIVQSCTTRWERSGCPGTATTLSAAAQLTLDSPEKPLLRQATPSVVHLRISVTGGGDPSGAATLILRAAAEQTSVEQTVGTTVLPATGGPSPALFAAPAAVLVGLGVALIARQRRRER